MTRVALEILEAIKQAEQAADTIVREAQQSARDMIAAAERSGAQRRREAGVKSREQYLALLDARREAVTGRLAEAAQQLHSQRLEAMASARQLLPEAAKLIVNKVLSDGDR